MTGTAGRVLAVRQDGAGDMLLTGPAIRALAHRASGLTVLAGPDGAAAARLLPGVDRVLTWPAPWIEAQPHPITRRETDALVEMIAAEHFDQAVVFTSFHQSPLPTALLLRLGGVRRISAISTDYPGTLLDVRHHVEEDQPEPERALSLAAAAGFPAPPGDDGRLAVRRPLPYVGRLTGPRPYVVVHPGASAPARTLSPRGNAEIVRSLVEAGYRVVVTGGARERHLTEIVAGSLAADLGGRTDLAELAAVLEGAEALVAPNTGAAHLAAAVGTPVACLYAPVVPAVRWAPYRVAHVLLGEQHAPCAGTRARHCPIVGHPCLESVTGAEVVDAVNRLVAQRPVRAAASTPAPVPLALGTRTRSEA
jgi:ADP-heptose:LPS heptosyltransferase